MAEYIERNALIEHIKKDPLYDLVEQYGITGVIESFPVVDVQPVKWIPVTERLPDFEGMCLCMRKSYSKANFRHQEIMYFDYDEQAFCSNVDGIFVADGNVTHWMPLPKPPKDGET